MCNVKSTKHVFHIRTHGPELVNAVFVCGHINAVGGLNQSSESVWQRGDRLCVTEKKRDRRKEKEKHNVSSDFKAPIIALTQAIAEACLSHGMCSVLTTYSEVPHCNSFRKMSVDVCGTHRWYHFWEAVLISVVLSSPGTVRHPLGRKWINHNVTRVTPVQSSVGHDNSWLYYLSYFFNATLSFSASGFNQIERSN